MHKAKTFTVHIEQEVLDDLARRLDNIRWPDETDEAGWDYGTDLGFSASSAAIGVTDSTGAHKKLD